LAMAGRWPAAGFLVVARLQSQATELPAASECVNFVILINMCLTGVFKCGKLFLECHSLQPYHLVQCPSISVIHRLDFYLFVL
jgi:hypothetical protein